MGENMNLKTTNLEKVVNQMVAHRRAGSAPPMALVERFREVASGEGGELGEVQAALIHTVALKNEERFFEAFDVFEASLKKFPTSVSLQIEWNQFKRNTLQLAESRMSMNPWDTSMARLYEKFLALGDVTIRFHAVMVEHYRLAGETRKAKSLSAKIVAVAPNYPGIQETIRRLGGEGA
jgi:hypothetical protein